MPETSGKKIIKIKFTICRYSMTYSEQVGKENKNKIYNPQILYDIQ